MVGGKLVISDSTIVTTFVAISAKISIFILLLEIVYFTSNYFSDFNWTFGLLMSSLFSLIIGTVVGLTQFRIKRLFAYSTPPTFSTLVN